MFHYELLRHTALAFRQTRRDIRQVHCRLSLKEYRWSHPHTRKYPQHHRSCCRNGGSARPTCRGSEESHYRAWRQTDRTRSRRILPHSPFCNHYKGLVPRQTNHHNWPHHCTLSWHSCTLDMIVTLKVQMMFRCMMSLPVQAFKNASEERIFLTVLAVLGKFV